MTHLSWESLRFRSHSNSMIDMGNEYKRKENNIEANDKENIKPFTYKIKENIFSIYSYFYARLFHKIIIICTCILFIVYQLYINNITKSIKNNINIENSSIWIDPTIIKSFELPLDIYIVNMKHRINRWNELLNKINKYSRFLSSNLVNIHRKEGIIGKKLNILEYYNNNNLSIHAYKSMLTAREIRGTHLTSGGLGCFISHYELWLKSIELNKIILIFEDDFEIINPLFDIYLNGILFNLPKDFGLIYLSDMVKTWKTKNSATEYNNNKYLYKINGEHWGTFGYLISPYAAKIFISNINKIHTQVDSFIINTCKKYNIPVFRTKKDIIMTDSKLGRNSDVQITYNDLNKLIRFIPFKLICINIFPFRGTPQTFENNYFNNKYIYHHSRYIKIQYENYNNQTNHINNLLFNKDIDFNYPLYHIELFGIQFHLLYENGGIFIAENSLTTPYNILDVMYGIKGLIVFKKDSTNGKITFPIIGSVKGNKWFLYAIEIIKNLIISYNNNYNNDTLNKENQIIHMGKEFLNIICNNVTYLPNPSNNTVLIIPLEVLNYKLP